MQVIRSTIDFTILGIPYPDVPILVDQDMVVVEPVLKFMAYQVAQNGSVCSPKTIRSYSDSLYDYFSFLEANNLKWNQPYRIQKDNEISVVALYRNWSLSLAGDAALKRSTINTRLAAIRQFYLYCHNRKLIDLLPWEHKLKLNTHSSEGFMRHVRAGNSTESSDLTLRVFREPLKLLNINQAKTLLNAIKNETHLLIVKLALTTGMRREELITFQREFVMRPKRTQLNSRLPITLTPSIGGQSTKGNRSRTIYIPAPLMADIHDYLQWGEGARRHNASNGADKSKVFLTGRGKQYSETSLNTLLKRLTSSGHIDFEVTPHMLRHTFATIELYSESRLKDMAQALAWVRDRLGHSSIKTTMIYIHCLEQLEDHELHQYQVELLELGNV